ncbi:hypothetical protein [Nocardioides marmoribigeumensis]|uniref:Sulfotransferase family protein n=1 Tax=Nocardioides marmoribigeumensis TaxID=433649 RepID=A0ABU2BXI1_9ACTN|nr:hypothetical protein [Nocardioides marmoribigeumensis]MDR7363097.1 hypothetical protein [Nocardioides marmoribigeumensis]
MSDTAPAVSGGEATTVSSRWDRPARVFLHIGLPKTGTTYVQRVLWENKARLRDNGVLLPGRHRRRHLLASLDVREDPKLQRRPGDVSHPWQDLVEEILEWDGDAEVSHEFFAAASTPQVQRIVDNLQDRELHVVVTARAMTELGVSRWQEDVKNGGTLPVDDYPAREDYDPTDEWGWGSFDLADILERWSAVVPPERIHVLVVAPGSGAPAELWLRFAEVMGLDGDDYEIPEAPVNTSLGLVEVELLRRVNAKLEGFSSAMARGRWIRGYLAEGDILPSRREKFRAGDAKRSDLQRRGERAVQLLRAGGYDVRGDLEALLPPVADGLRHPDEVSAEELLDSATTAIARLLRDVRTLTRERDELMGRDLGPGPVTGDSDGQAPSTTTSATASSTGHQGSTQASAAPAEQLEGAPLRTKVRRRLRRLRDRFRTEQSGATT